ncbi:hypothetical protein E2C01_049234 [Portunus trituberculatus]|uniref:Uncharacterized protein n=1 Tax=Portunus trituberculatus TaxID=210409 RepID=A0A5B7G8V8_PORTR|nr:hypothetical protein [Portunus trituberculatus]
MAKINRKQARWRCDALSEEELTVESTTCGESNAKVLKLQREVKEEPEKMPQYYRDLWSSKN